jgi:hypothetical protein
MTSAGGDRRAYQMVIRKGDPGYSVSPKRTLFADGGTEVRISPLLDGVRTLSGEKIQWYLAAELRDRIRQTGVRISIVDRLARKQYAVEPRQYEGRLLHQLPPVPTPLGDIYVELYLDERGEANRVALYRRGTRVIDDLTLLDHLARTPWNSHLLQGHLDAPFLELTPGTRAGIIQDSAYMRFCEALAPLEQKLIEIIEAQRRAEEEKASREQLRTIQRVFREALLALPSEEYDWFEVSARRLPSAPEQGSRSDLNIAPNGCNDATELDASEPGAARQRQFFEFPGPLFSVMISPASSIVCVGGRKELQALPRDRSRRRVDEDLEFHWKIAEGLGKLTSINGQVVTFLAPEDPGLTRISVSVSQRDITCVNEALLTITKELVAQINPITIPARGLPGYTFERAPGESWRSKFHRERNLIVVNNGHRDFVYASRTRLLKLRYLVRLYELVMHFCWPSRRPAVGADGRAFIANRRASLMGVTSPALPDSQELHRIRVTHARFSLSLRPSNAECQSRQITLSTSFAPFYNPPPFRHPVCIIF